MLINKNQTHDVVCFDSVEQNSKFLPPKNLCDSFQQIPFRSRLTLYLSVVAAPYVRFAYHMIIVFIMMILQ